MSKRYFVPPRRIKGVLFYLVILLTSILLISGASYTSEDYTGKLVLTPEESAFLEAHPVIRIGIDPDFMPMEGISDAGVYHGIAADYVKDLEQLLGIKMEPVPSLSWSEVLEGAKNGSIDVVTCLGSTEERMQYLTFTDAYLRFPAVFFARNSDKRPYGLETLLGKKLVIVENYWIHSIFRNVHPEVELITYPTARQCLESLLTGESDAFLSDLASASYLINEMGLSNLRVAGRSPYDLALRMGVRKDFDAFVPILDKALAAIPERRRNEIQSKWIRVDQREIFETREFWLILGAVLSIAMLSLFAISTWNRTLKHQVALKTQQLDQEFKERQAAETKFHKVFLHAADAIGLVRLRDGSFLEVNEAFLRIFGYSAEEVLGHSSIDFNLYVTVDDRDAVYRQLNTGNRIENMEICWVTKAGNPRTGLLSTELIDVDGEPCITFVWHDVTERIASETALRTAYDSLEQKVQERTSELEIEKERAESASKAKSVFLANISHELRTPLNAILGYSHLLMKDSRMSEQQIDDLQIILRSGEHLLKLINEVLEMSRIEAGRAVLNLTTFNLRAMINDLETMFRMRTEEKRLRLTIQIDPDVPEMIVADENKLRQIMINLISNAIKFTDMGEVAVRLTATQRTPDKINLTLVVEDTGPGISPSELPRLFQPFQQSESGIRSGIGSGLGLTISREFARLMDGELTADSQVGKGSIFTCSMVVQASQDFRASEGMAAPEVIGLEPGQPCFRILVADDVAENRSLLVRLLDVLKCEVREAPDGQEVLRIWEEWQPQLILMDLRMPVVSGYEAMKMIRAKDPGNRTRMIVVTASAFDGDRKNVIGTTGASGFVRKPVVASELYQTIAQCMGIRLQYAESIPHFTSGAQTTLSQDDTSRLPEPLQTELFKAASQADLDRILEITAELDSDMPDMARQIRGLAEQYRYDLLMTLFNRRK